MLISAHFPINHMSECLRHVDFPFILAHLWRRKPYRDKLQSFRNTWAIVDNSMHETGGPVGIAEIASCLDSAGGWVGILPDKIHKPIFTWSSAIRAAQRYGIDFRHWGVVLHSSNAAYVRFQHDLAVSLGVGLIGFPYKARRWEYLDERVLKFEYDQRYHLLGLNERDELEKYATLPGRWSIDTMKLWKVDLTKPGWHGHTRNIEHDDVDIELLKNNVAYLRELFYARSSGGVSTSSTQ